MKVDPAVDPVVDPASMCYVNIDPPKLVLQQFKTAIASGSHHKGPEIVNTVLGQCWPSSAVPSTFSHQPPEVIA